MKKKIILHFKSDKFLRVFYYSNLRQKLENEYNLFYLTPYNTSFKNKIRPENIFHYPKALLIENILFSPSVFFKYIIYKMIDILSFKNINFRALTYRFNIINDLGFQSLKNKEISNKFNYRKESAAGNYLYSFYGFPFSKNKTLLSFFNFIFNLTFSNFHPGFYKFFSQKKFDGIIYFHIQCEETFLIKKITNSLNIPSINIIYGWDQPTLKGIMSLSQKEELVVTNNQMKNEINIYHNIQNDKIFNLGNFFLEKIYLNKNNNIYKNKILYALNTFRLNSLEIENIKKIKNYIESNKIELELVLRPHPHDQEYYKLLKQENLEHVQIMESNFHDFDNLTKIMNETKLLISFGTSMFLDGRALGVTCASLVDDNLMKDASYYKKYLKFLVKGKNKIVYTNVDMLFKEFLSGELEKKNKELDKIYIEPLNSNISDEYLKFIKKII